tara:strand:+ start:246 stop:956 length:711 start_codon:yes stop_codon:yes gene_type:complete
MIIFRFIVLFFSSQIFVLDKDEIKAKLNEIIPDEISIETVDDTYSSNFFSVELSDGSLFYVTADGEFIINGDLYQIKKNSLINFSDMRDSKIRINKILEINPSEFITFKPKEKKTDIYVFTDVDCGYCRKLHSEITSYLENGIQVNYLAFPREGLESETYQKMNNAWCSKDPQASLTNLKLGKTIKSDDCTKKIVSRHYNLAKEFNAQGTPTIILENGFLLAGYYSAEEILKFLKK